jgi:hypothetical protein
VSQNIIACFTLIDISQTNTIRPFKHTVSSCVDAVGQPINNTASWTISRNKQRNWETLLQTISLRTQIDNIQILPANKCDIAQYKFGKGYTGLQTVWAFRFSVEYAEVFDKNGLRLAALTEDVNNVPCILDLTETVKIPKAMFITQGKYLNTYFEFV